MGHTEQGLAQGQGTERTARRGPGRISQAADKGQDEDPAGQESPRLALLGSAVVLPLAAAVGGRALFALDAGVPVPVVEIALLRSLPLFGELPAPAIEHLAAALTQFACQPAES